jgi:hypothetical protein
VEEVVGEAADAVRPACDAPTAGIHGRT